MITQLAWCGLLTKTLLAFLSFVFLCLSSASAHYILAMAGGGSNNETVKAAQVGTPLDHPRLVKVDHESIRTFLRNYDQYTNIVLAHAKQFATTGESTVTAESVRPVNLKFCVDGAFRESYITLGFIDVATDYNSLTNEQLRKFLDDRCQDSKGSMMLDSLEAIVDRDLRADMQIKNAATRMKDLLTKYHTTLSRHGLKWIVKENQKITVQHILSAVRRVSIREQLTCDLSFSRHHLHKDFTGFLKHAVRISEAFQLVDCGPSGKGCRNSEKTDKTNRSSKPRSGN